MTFKKLPPLENPGHRSNCLNCGPQPIELPMDSFLATGFGQVDVTRDGECVWSGDDIDKIISEFEKMARKEPNKDWRVSFHGPMSDTTYQRQGKNKWVLVEKGEGFA